MAGDTIIEALSSYIVASLRAILTVDASITSQVAVANTSSADVERWLECLRNVSKQDDNVDDNYNPGTTQLMRRRLFFLLRTSLQPKEYKRVHISGGAAETVLNSNIDTIYAAEVDNAVLGAAQTHNTNTCLDGVSSNATLTAT